MIARLWQFLKRFQRQNPNASRTVAKNGYSVYFIGEWLINAIS